MNIFFRFPYYYIKISVEGEKMKKKILLIFFILILLILIFYCYKFFIPGNNINIENVNELDFFISKINEFKAESRVTIHSNKNYNEYILLQSYINGVSRQEIRNSENGCGIIIENVDNCLSIKNTELPVEKVFSNYSGVMRNSFGLDSFVEDYLYDENKEIISKDEYYIINVKSKNSQNKYSLSKTLFFNKEKNIIEKIVVKDINNNETIVIEYIKLEIL